MNIFLSDAVGRQESFNDFVADGEHPHYLPSVICVGLSVLYLIGLFFRGKDFMQECRKNSGYEGKVIEKIRRAGKKWMLVLFLPAL